MSLCLSLHFCTRRRRSGLILIQSSYQTLVVLDLATSNRIQGCQSYFLAQRRKRTSPELGVRRDRVVYALYNIYSLLRSHSRPATLDGCAHCCASHVNTHEWRWVLRRGMLSTSPRESTSKHLNAVAVSCSRGWLANIAARTAFY